MDFEIAVVSLLVIVYIVSIIIVCLIIYVCLKLRSMNQSRWNIDANPLFWITDHKLLKVLRREVILKQYWKQIRSRTQV